MAHINEDNVGNFYLGTAVEHYVISQFYLFGFEAHKANPDFGYDLFISNKAQQIFREKEAVFKYVQIKSTPSFQNSNYEFWVSKEDFNLILNDGNAYIIFVICSFEYENDPISLVPTYIQSMEMLDEMINSDAINGFYDEKEKKKMIHEFNIVNFNTLWFNSNQLKRLDNDDFFMDIQKNERQHKILNLSLNEYGDFYLKKAISSDKYRIIPELTNLYYILNNSSSQEEINDGSMFYEDL